jgi:hypothetical protein
VGLGLTVLRCPMVVTVPMMSTSVVIAPERAEAASAAQALIVMVVVTVPQRVAASVVVWEFVGLGLTTRTPDQIQVIVMVAFALGQVMVVVRVVVTVVVESAPTPCKGYLQWAAAVAIGFPTCAFALAPCTGCRAFPGSSTAGSTER